MADNKIEQLKKLLLEKYKTRVFFSSEAIKDYKSFSPGKRNDVLKLILKQEGQLHQFAKIKSKQLNLRIIYQPQLDPDDVVEMGIIAIGPRDDLEVYKMAIRRLADE